MVLDFSSKSILGYFQITPWDSFKEFNHDRMYDTKRKYFICVGQLIHVFNKHSYMFFIIREHAKIKNS